MPDGEVGAVGGGDEQNPVGQVQGPRSSAPLAGVVVGCAFCTRVTKRWNWGGCRPVSANRPSALMVVEVMGCTGVGLGAE